VQSDLLRRLSASAALLGCALLWGSPIPVIGEMTQRWDLVTLGAVRYALALPLVFLIASASIGWRMPPLRPEGVSLVWLIAVGGVGLAGFALLYIVALSLMDPGTAAVIAAMAPITSGLVSSAFGQRPGRGLVVAVVLSVGGAALAAVDLDSPGDFLKLQGGEPLFILAQALWAWYSLACRRAMPTTPATLMTFATMVPGALTLFLAWVVGASFGWLMPWPAVIPTHDYYYIALLGFGSVALAIVFWNVGVAGLGLIASSLHMNLIPLIAMLAAYALGEPPRWEQVVGGAIVIVGVLQVQLGYLTKRRRLAD